jgi:hypothetical protein
MTDREKLQQLFEAAMKSTAEIGRASLQRAFPPHLAAQPRPLPASMPHGRPASVAGPQAYGWK